MTTNTAPRTPTVAIARVLRGLGLTQGRGCDFRVTGEYRNGERVGTFVLALTLHADEVIAEHADDIERLTADSSFPFRVSVRYYNGKPRPVPTVANYGSRIRETPPEPDVSAQPPAPEPVPAPAAPQPEPEAESLPAAPPAGTRSARHFTIVHEAAWARQRANALGWSTAQAELVDAAGSVRLVWHREDGAFRLKATPRHTGTTVDPARLAPLLKAGLLAVTEHAGGYKTVGPTADGREALLLWRQYRPAPVVKDRAEEREPLRPLLGGEFVSRRARAAAEEDRHRKAQREAMYAALEELHAWEERDDRLWNAWATVHDITHRLGRRRPVGWVPTEEEIAAHHLDPAVVAELRAEAGCPQAKPKLPASPSIRSVEMPPLEAAPYEREQLTLFAC